LVQDLGGERERVALRARGTHELAVGFLAIQRAGMVAVPVDPTAPVEHLQTIVADVEPSMLLSDVEGDETLGLSTPVFHPLTFGSDMDPVAVDRERGELVSIVYTSGSTGSPKGIMMGREHMNALFARLPDYQIPEGTRLGTVTAGTVTHAELIVGSVLVVRGTLVAYEIRRRGLTDLGKWLHDTAVDSCFLVPTILRYLLPALPPEQIFSSLRTVVLSGETSTWDDVTELRRHLSPEAVIVNVFGQTETVSIASLIIPSDAGAGDGPLPAGQVSPGMDVAILDPEGRSVLRGERGEIVVQSRSLSLGYWRRPDLTRATFRDLEDGRREVRTGDAGRLLADGTLEHLGRLDHLVKISGNRVELGEVETALIRIDGVAAATAAPYIDDTQNTRLTASVVSVEGAPVDPRAVRAALSRQLPGYMVPDHIAVVDALPRLPGGKVDRAQVADTRVADSPRHAALDPNISELECSLESIWRKILQLDSIDRHDDFFENGGDSMRAARMFVELDRRLGIDQPVSLLAEAPTIASLAAMLSADQSAWHPLLALRTEGTRPPLFVIHDGGGHLLFARGLARELGADQPIYGLRCEGLNGTPLKEKSLDELAATYVRKMQALYPNGPYLLYGPSLGGVIALEMAHQLTESGEEVPLVMLGDSPVPGCTLLPTAASENRPIGLRVKDRIDVLRDPQELLSRLRRRIDHRRRRAGGELLPTGKEGRLLDRSIRRGEPIPVLLRSHYVLREYGRLLSSYQPSPPWPERVVLLRTRDEPDESAGHGWGQILDSALSIVDVPGAHNDLGLEASCPYVGPAISRALDRVAPGD
jgi:acyl-coenzyme A synthetase/AMP-(fatty) acid ligase/thioesterase domain-containing protein/acyl carrier protein